ncbi:MAG: hypothetical protein PHT46_01565 [Candidatus Marinimicrobia bacterium]|jgi:drug/metabolite transporter (DMT)-like permease|nr:hypothetical protein [Candidatus Neomarinimicrobiota bacterium]MDX9777428.1 hypothetical protein [bacterium]
MTGSILLAMLSGVCFSVIGIMMRLGQNKNVVPLHISMCMGIAGALYFAFQINWKAWDVPVYVIIMSLCGTVGMIASMIFSKMSLKRGPLSPLWTATNLTFIVVTLYAALMFGEKIALMQGLALLFGIVCVIFAANLGDQPKDSESAGKGMRIRLEYALLLFLVLLGNSFSFLVIKDLGTRLIPGSETPYIALYRPHMYFFMYSSMALASFLIVKFIDRSKPVSYKWVWGLGFLAAAGSISGMLMLSSVVDKLPASVVFTLNSICCILVACIVSVTAFREKIKAAWWGTIAFGLIAVVLANIV